MSSSKTAPISTGPGAGCSSTCRASPGACPRACGRGYVKSVDDIKKIAVGTNGSGTPILVRDIGQVHLGPDLRRGLVELDGEGETVGGVVVMRHGENALRVIEGVKAKLQEVHKSLPPGVEIVTTYDRSTLIERAIATLKHTLTEELVIVSLVILVFLWH